jgi:hypothetical protein
LGSRNAADEDLSVDPADVVVSVAAGRVVSAA